MSSGRRRRQSAERLAGAAATTHQQGAAEEPHSTIALWHRKAQRLLDALDSPEAFEPGLRRLLDRARPLLRRHEPSDAHRKERAFIAFLDLCYGVSMGVVADKRRWFEQVVALRRAERAAPGVREIPLVRSQIEEQIGSALSMSMAASVLDVSEATIRRWVRRGTLPTVITGQGRTGIPVGPLADLHEEVARQRAQGRRHVLEPAMTAAQQAAQRMRIDPAAAPAGDPHGRSLARALAYPRAVARKLTRAMADEALHRVWEWESQDRIAEEYARRWEQLLRGPLPAIRAAISATGPDADDLRQSSPLAGALSEPERRRILAEVR